jgi:hypothetical protein
VTVATALVATIPATSNVLPLGLSTLPMVAAGLPPSEPEKPVLYGFIGYDPAVGKYFCGRTGERS